MCFWVYLGKIIWNVMERADGLNEDADGIRKNSIQNIFILLYFEGIWSLGWFG